MADLLASVADLGNYLDDTLDEARAEFLLRLASGEVRAYCGQLFDFVEDDDVVLDGKGSTVLLLPELPVVSVDEVLEIGTPATTLAGPSESSPAYEWNADGILRRIDGNVFVRRFRWYQVTYSHGWATVPDEVQLAVLRVAARAYDNPDGLRQETLLSYSYTVQGDQAGVGLLEADRAALAEYRIGGRGRAGTPGAGS